MINPTQRVKIRSTLPWSVLMRYLLSFLGLLLIGLRVVDQWLFFRYLQRRLRRRPAIHRLARSFLGDR